MNRGHHMSYQYRIVNKKEGSDIVGLRPWLDYTMPLLCLSYKGPKGEEQKNKNYLGRFPYLQGHPVPQAGYTGDGGGESASHMPKSSFSSGDEGGDSASHMPKSNFSSGDKGRDSGSHMPKSNFSSGNGDGDSSTHMLKSSFAPANGESITCMLKSCRGSSD